jgi:hypothetical protein
MSFSNHKNFIVKMGMREARKKIDNTILNNCIPYITKKRRRKI